MISDEMQKRIEQAIRDVLIQHQSASASTLLGMIKEIKENLSKFYTSKEIDLMILEIKSHLSDQDKSLLKILEQTTKHNGRMSKLERYLLIVGCITGTVLLLKFPDVIEAIKLFI